MIDEYHGGYRGAEYLRDLLGIPIGDAEVLVAMGRHPGRDILDDEPACGAALIVGGKETHCVLVRGHRREHDWAWMMKENQ